MALQGSLTIRTIHPKSDEPPKSATLVFLDSTDLQSYPDIGSTYAPAGGQVKADTPGQDKLSYGDTNVAVHTTVELPQSEISSYRCGRAFRRFGVDRPPYFPVRIGVRTHDTG